VSWFPSWSSIVGAIIVIGAVEITWRIRRIRRQYTDHRVARFFDLLVDTPRTPSRVYWLEGVTQSDVENALYGHTDHRWGWLCRPDVRRVLIIANPMSWALTIYGASDGPLSLSLADTAMSWWGLLPIPLWLAVRRSVRLIADAPTNLLDERLVAMRDRTYLHSYRWLGNLGGIVASVMIVVNDAIGDLNDESRVIQLEYLTAAAYASIWAIPALPSVVLAWTLRNERLLTDNHDRPITYSQERLTMTTNPALSEGVSANTNDDPNTGQRRDRPIFIILLAVALVAGLVTGIVASRNDQASNSEASQGLVWESIGGGLEEAGLTVPVDHDQPDGETLDLRVLKRPADDPEQRIGSLLINPGGPGFGAEIMVVGAENFFASEMLEKFDIIGMDPRGTGGSSPAIDCIDDYDALTAATDLTPQDDTARQAQIALAADFSAACIERTGDAIAHMTTTATARDLDALRRSLGEETISFFGASYGCELGAAWVTLFPNTVRAAVLDGCADPISDPIESARQQSAGFQASLEEFLGRCLEVGAECPIPHNGDPTEAFLELWSRAADSGIPGTSGRPPVNESVLQTATIMSMYSEELWPTLADAIALGLEGDGSVLQQLADTYTQRREDGTWGNELEAFTVIECMDAISRPSAEEYAALAAELASIAPLIHPAGSFSAPVCNSLPLSADDPIEITGAGAPALIVIGNTGDPATPFASTEKMAAALESAVLIAVESLNHGGYGFNECINDTVHRYLIDQVVPDPNTRC
jgi:pimeloyl-ACP methyl ester carboxylesterase